MVDFGRGSDDLPLRATWPYILSRTLFCLEHIPKGTYDSEVAAGASAKVPATYAPAHPLDHRPGRPVLQRRGVVGNKVMKNSKPIEGKHIISTQPDFELHGFNLPLF